MKIFLRLFVFSLGLACLTLTARAQSVYDEIQGKIKADEQKYMDLYGKAQNVQPTDSAWTKHAAFYRETGGPMLASYGIYLKPLFMGDNTRYLWWTVLGVLSMFSFSHRFHSGRNIDHHGMIVWALKLMVLMFVFSAPAQFYALSMTLKDAFSLIASQALSSAQSDQNSLLNQTLNFSSRLSPNGQVLDNALIEGVTKAYNNNTVNLNGAALPATMQVYNQLATALNATMTGEYASHRFRIAPFTTSAVQISSAASSGSSQAKAPPPGNKFDGLYTSMAAVSETDQSSIAINQLVQDTNNKLAESQYDYSNLDVQKWNDIYKQDLPQLLAYVLYFSYRDDVKAALQAGGVQAYPFGRALITQSGQDQVAQKSQQYRTSSDPLPTWDQLQSASQGYSPASAGAYIPTDNAGNVVATAQQMLIQNLQIATNAGIPMTSAQLDGAAKSITQFSEDATSRFIQRVFTGQYKNHMSSKIRGYWRTVIMGSPSGSVPVDVNYEGELGVSGTYTKKIVDFISKGVRLLVIKIFTTVMDATLELNILLFWMAGSMWLFEKTSKPFGMYFQSVVTASLMVPTLALLLTCWDLIVTGFIRSSTPNPIGNGGISSFIAAGEEALLMASGLGVVNMILASVFSVIGIILIGMVTPKIARAFFEGGNVAGALGSTLIGAVVGTASVAAAVGGAAVGGVGGVAVAGKGLSSLGGTVAKAQSGTGGESAGGVGPAPNQADVESTGAANLSPAVESAGGLGSSSLESRAHAKNAPSVARSTAAEGVQLNLRKPQPPTQATPDFAGDSQPSESQAADPTTVQSRNDIERAQNRTGITSPPSIPRPGANKIGTAWNMAQAVGSSYYGKVIGAGLRAIPEAIVMSVASGGEVGTMMKLMSAKRALKEMGSGMGAPQQSGNANDVPVIQLKRKTVQTGSARPKVNVEVEDQGPQDWGADASEALRRPTANNVRDALGGA